jgi:ATP-dependent Lhr-like helicase
LREQFPLDGAGAWNIREYFRKQRESTGVIPGNRLILVEGFRDEIGDPRIVVHSSFGRRVNGLLGLVLARRLRELTGVEPQVLSNDDAVLLRSSDADSLPLDLLDGVSAENARNVVLEDIPTSPLFGGQFRQNAARALLMPRSMPGKRTPLWLQRLRAGDLLQIARRYDDFPIVIETMREVLHDVLDFDHFLEVIRGIESGALRVETVLTETPSPFASSVLFDFIAVYMYEWDQPKAAAGGDLLPVNRDVLGEIVSLDSPPPVLRPDAITQVEAQFQHTAPGSRARSPGPWWHPRRGRRPRRGR